MRKFLLILFALTACLQIQNGRGVEVQCQVEDGSAVAVGREIAQWRCERIYNSDFNTPGDIRVEAPVSVTAPAFRNFGYAGSVRALLRQQAECAVAAAPNLTAEYESSYLSALTHGAGYCVRLRRLII